MVVDQCMERRAAAAELYDGREVGRGLPDAQELEVLVEVEVAGLHEGRQVVHHGPLVELGERGEALSELVEGVHVIEHPVEPARVDVQERRLIGRKFDLGVGFFEQQPAFDAIDPGHDRDRPGFGGVLAAIEESTLVDREPAPDHPRD